MSVGTILLALGALALLVSGAIFITVYWGPMGILGRALVLLAVTAVAGTVAAVVTRRRLRASAEALWTVFLGLFSLDWFAARDQGLLGLDVVSPRAWVLLWAVFVVGVVVLVVRFGRRRLDDAQELVSVSIVGGLAAVGAGLALASVVDVDLGRRVFWAVGAALLVLLAGAAVLRRGSAHIGAWVALAGAAVAGASAVILAVAQVIAEPSARAVVLEGEGGPLALVVVLAAVAASLRRVPPWPRTVAAGLAVACATTLVALPAWSAEPSYGGLLVLCAVAVGTAWLPGGGPWPRGARAVGVAPAAVVGAAFLPWVAQLLATIGTALVSTGGHPIDRPLSTVDVAGTGRLWLGAVLGLSLAVIALGVGRWRLLAVYRKHAVGAATTLAVLTGWAIVAGTAPPAVLLAVSVVAGAVLLWAVAGRRGTGWWWLSTTTLVVAPVLALDAPWACVVVWPVAAVALVVVGRRPPSGPWSGAVADGLAAAWGPAAVAALCVALDATPEVHLAATVGAALVTAVAATLLVADAARRTGVEVAAAVLILVAVLTTDPQVDVVVGAVAALVVSGCAVLLAYAPRGRRTVHPVVGTAAAIVALALTAGDWRAATVVWTVAVLPTLVGARRVEEPVVRTVLTAVGMLLVGLVVVPVTRLAEAGDGLTGVVTSVVGAVLLLLATRRRRDVAARLGTEAGAGLVLLGGVLWAAGATDPQVRWLAATLLVVAASSVVASLLVPDRAVLRLVGGVVALATVGVTADHMATALLAWPLAALLLGGCALRDDGPAWRDVAVGAAAGVGLGSALPVLELLDAGPRVTSLVLLVLAVVAGVAASTLLGDRRGRRGAELVLLALAVVTVLWGTSTTSTAWVALLLTVLGAGLALVSLLAPDRGLVRWAALGPLSLAYVLRLVASDVGVVEAYTVPFALGLLVAGLWVLLRTEPPRSTIVALGPGLTLGLAPSLPQALLEPTSPRGLLLGLVGLAVLAVGVRYRWKAPFVAGAVVVALLLVVQLGPVAVALPRWVLIAVAGVTMLGVGMTWESRVREGRAAARWIGAMR